MIKSSGSATLAINSKSLIQAGQHADFGIGRRFLRMAMCLMRSSQVYLPPKLRSPKTQMQERAGYYLTAWPLLRDKWKKA